METLQITLPTIEQVEFTIECSPEDIPVKGNCSAIDEETDRATEEMIYEQLDNGNEWAWCSVEVKATWKGISCSDYLGCCSYKSKEDFMKDGYYNDMKQTAFDELIEEIKNLAD